MDKRLNESAQLLRDQCRGYIERMLSRASKAVETDPVYLAELLKNLASVGIPGILIPAEWEGQGGGMREASVIMEEVSRSDPRLALMLLYHLACARGLVLWASEQQKACFLPELALVRRLGAVAITEPDAGSDLASIKAGIKRRGWEMVLNGNKCFVTNTLSGMDFYVLGLFREATGFSLALVPSGSPGLHLAHFYRFAGWQGLPNHALVLQDCAVPLDHLIAEALTLKELEPWLDDARLLVCAIAAGMAQACLEEAMSYCAERRQYEKKLIEHQSLRFSIADMAMGISLLRTGIEWAARGLDEGRRLHQEICMLKLFSTSQLERIASSAMEMAGGYGYTAESRLSRLHRDSKALQLLWGTREMMRLEIARELSL